MNENFFSRDTRVVARDLLGRAIIRKVSGRTVRAIITETEAYKGFADKAAHASRGKTKRNVPMFGPAYVMKEVSLLYPLYYTYKKTTSLLQYTVVFQWI